MGVRKARRGRRRWLLAIAAALGFGLVASVALVLPLRWIPPATTAFMLQDDSGRVPVAYEWTGWDSLGDAVKLAVVAAEDQKFADHFGFDLESIRDSIEEYGEGDRLRGASTITQQLAKNLYLWPGRSFVRKGLEAWFSLLIELLLPKRRILEIYVNVAEFGPGIYGASAAAHRFFGRPPMLLSDRQAALLAAVLPSPARYDALRPSGYVRERQRWIHSQMQRLRREAWLRRLE